MSAEKVEKVRWGVIGAGGIARRRTIPEGLMKASNAQLVSVQDAIYKSALEVAHEFNVRPCETIDELLKTDIQAVYIASPPEYHYEQLKIAIEAGKHVLVEKPLAVSFKTAESMVDLARKSGLYCMEGYMMKFHPLHQRARELVWNEIGRSVFIRGQLSCWYPPIQGAWRQNPDRGGGGALIDMGSHIFDLMQWILNSRIVEVTAMCDTIVHTDYPVEDAATVLCRFKNGCLGVVETFFCMRDEACLRRLEIQGTEGGILADGTIGQGGGVMQVNLLGPAGGYDAQQERKGYGSYQLVVAPGESNMYCAEVEYFSDCILRSAPPEMNTLESGLQILNIVQTAYKSSETGGLLNILV